MKLFAKSTLSVVATALLLIAFTACNKDSMLNCGFSGKAQKGPFVTGTEINLYELNENLSQTGKAFRTTISSNDGSFSLENLELGSQYALLSANGFFFSEIYGELTASQLNLQAVANIADKEHLNINSMTNVTAPRIIKLVGDGLTFAVAKEQAEKELLAFLGVEEGAGAGFDQMDLSENEDYNGILLSFSLMLQHYTNYVMEQSQFVAELTQLLADINADFTPDGDIDNQQIIDALLYNASMIDRAQVRERIENYYEELGLRVEIPDFEKYLALFQEKHDNNLITDFYYPEMASPDPVHFPNDILPNILEKDLTTLTLEESYVAAAAVPFGKTLKIKIYTDSPSACVTPPYYGWEFSKEDNVWVLESKLENAVMACTFNLDPTGSTQHGEATIEYYEDSETPTFTKHVTW